MLIFVFIATLGLASPLSSAIVGGPSETPHFSPTCHGTPLIPATPHFDETPLLDETPHLFHTFTPLETPHLFFTCFRHGTPLPLACLHFSLSFPTMAEQFVCQHKGRALWDTHPSCVTCRIRQDILCSRDYPCAFCSSWSEREWVFQELIFSRS